MVSETERLIERLVAEAAPVRRLRPPLLRTALWLGAVGVVIVAAILTLSDLEVFVGRARDPKLVFELVGTALTGLLAVIAAFELSLPDRSWRWSLLPLPSLALWLASSVYSCWRHWIAVGGDGWQLGESAHCFGFILGVSAPLALSLLVLLRRARPLAPLPVAAAGGLGVAAIAAFALQFFHPFDVTFIDLGVHVVAVAIVVLASAGGERLSLAARA